MNQITVSQDNKRYSLYDNKIIIGKSSITDTNYYDVLVFCVRNIKEISIPSFIKYIASYAFNCCKKLQKCEIPLNSELLSIGDYALSYSSITKFTIPPQITTINKGTFSCCEDLQKIEIQTNSKLCSIENVAFNDTSIVSFSIPCHVTQIGKQVLS